VNDPSIILADEPTGNLDTRTGNEIIDLFSQIHRERNITVIFVTHDPELAERVPRRLMIRDGLVVADERAGEVLPATQNQPPMGETYTPQEKRV